MCLKQMLHKSETEAIYESDVYLNGNMYQMCVPGAIIETTYRL
jgi:hypothetical protein